MEEQAQATLRHKCRWRAVLCQGNAPSANGHEGWDAGMKPEAELANPMTPPERLAEIAQDRYDLHGQILGHPNCYPGLAEWLREASPGVVAIRVEGVGAGPDAPGEGVGAGPDAPVEDAPSEVLARPVSGEDAPTEILTGPLQAGPMPGRPDQTQIQGGPMPGGAVPGGPIPGRPVAAGPAQTQIQGGPMPGGPGAQGPGGRGPGGPMPGGPGGSGPGGRGQGTPMPGGPGAPMPGGPGGPVPGGPGAPAPIGPMSTGTGTGTATGAGAGPGAQAPSKSIWKKPWFVVGIVILALLLVAGIVFAVYAFTSGGKEKTSSGSGIAEIAKRASEAKPEQDTQRETGTSKEKSTNEDQSVFVPDTTYPGALIPGAYPDAGGPRPASATPISSVYEMEYSGTFATLVTPSGNIGCDFTWDLQACGVISYIEDQPYGAEEHSGPYWWITFTDGEYPFIYPKGDVAMFMFPEYPAQVVEYGEIVYWEDVVCASEEEGLTCWNTTTGHGAFMSRSGYEGF